MGWFKKLLGAEEEVIVEPTRSLNPPKYQELKCESVTQGKFNNLIEDIETHYLVVNIIGKARAGKTGLAFNIMENLAHSSKRKCYALYFPRMDELPEWIEGADNVEDVENGSIVLVDEAGVTLESRGSMQKANRIISSILHIRGHKKLTLIFIQQNSATSDLNIARQTDVFIIKKPSLLQYELERPAIRKLLKKMGKNLWDKFKTHDTEKESKNYFKKYAYVFSDEFEGLISNVLPSFWSDDVSEAYKGFRSKEKDEKNT